MKRQDIILKHVCLSKSHRRVKKYLKFLEKKHVVEDFLDLNDSQFRCTDNFK